MKSTPSHAEISPWLIWPVAALAAGIGVACACLLSVYLLPRGNPAVWVWQLRKQAVPPLPWTLPAAIVLLFVGLLALDSLRAGKLPSRLSCAVFVACLTVASATLMTCMSTDDLDYPFRAAATTLGELSMGYYAQARKVQDPLAYIRDVSSRTDLGRAPERVATHPPGPVLYFWAARRWLAAHPPLVADLRARLERWSGDKDLVGTTALSRRVATFGPDEQDVVLAFWPAFILGLVAPLVIPLVFGLGALAGDRRLGLTAAVIACAIPSLLCFSPSVDALAAVLAQAVVLTWLWALRSRRWMPAVLCGALWMVGLFWTFGLLALAALLGIVGLWWWAESGKTARPAPAILGVCIGMALASLAGLALLGYNPLSSMAHSFAAQRAIMLTFRRPYQLSLLWNLYDFTFFAGPTLVLVAVVGAVLGMGKRWKPRLPSALAAGLALTLLALVLTGSTRGEVGRIWGFLMPCLAVPAAFPIGRQRSWNLMGAGTLILAAQLALTITINCYLSLVTP